MVLTLPLVSPAVVAETTTLEGRDGAEEDGAWHDGGLSSRLGALRIRGLWADCELVVGESATRVTAHRVLLAAASPVLASMIFGPLAQANRPLALPDIEPEVFDLLLQYMYTDDMTLNSCDEACSLYRAAHYLILPQVEAVCKTFLLNNLTPESVISVYEFAQLFEENEVTEKCLELMASETIAVLNGPKLETACAETLVHLFSLPDLTLGSELDLFQAAERWVHAGQVLNQESSEVEFETADAKPESGAANNVADRKKLIRDVLKQIRFLSMDPAKFAEYDMSSLLNESDILAISLNLLSDHAYMSMPSGFSLLKETRNLKGRGAQLRVTIPNIKGLRQMYSDTFYVEDMPWRLDIREDRDRLQVYLDTNWDKEINWSCEAVFELKVISPKGSCGFKQNSEYQFTGTGNELENKWYYRFAPWRLQDLRDKGVICDDSITLDIRVEAHAVAGFLRY